MKQKTPNIQNTPWGFRELLNKYSADKVDQLNDTSLSDIIARNTGVDNIQDDAMAVRQKDW